MKEYLTYYNEIIITYFIGTFMYQRNQKNYHVKIIKFIFILIFIIKKKNFSFIIIAS